MYYDIICVWVDIMESTELVESGVYVGHIEEYLCGIFDEIYQGFPNYIPAGLKMPNYRRL